MYTWVNCPLFILSPPFHLVSRPVNRWLELEPSVLTENWQPKVANFVAWLEEYNYPSAPFKRPDILRIDGDNIIDKITPDTCAQIAQENNSIGCY